MKLTREQAAIVAFVMNAHGMCKVTEKICIASECRPYASWKLCQDRVELEDWYNQSSGEKVNG